MNAELLPLDGKYYGTQVLLKDGKNVCNIPIWFSQHSKPSKRQLEAWDNLTDEELSDLISDAHFETQENLKIAEIIVNAINSQTAREKGGM